MIDWRKVFVGGMMGVVVVGCASQQQDNSSAEATLEAHDPDARAFNGTIVSLRPIKTEMLISKDEYHGHDAFPNIILVKWDTQTRFSLDGQPTTLDQLRQYMPVQVKGHMREGQLFAESAAFSSVLPKNVIPAGSAQAQTDNHD
jgi:hypothetical protein